MSTSKSPIRRGFRWLAILCLALTALPILAETASAQRFGGRGYGRGGGFYNRGFRGEYGNRDFYRGYNGSGYGYPGSGYGNGYYNSGYSGYAAPAYSPFHGGLPPNSLASPYVTPNVIGGYGGYN